MSDVHDIYQKWYGEEYIKVDLFTGKKYFISKAKQIVYLDYNYEEGID
jgi:hypothetical protein